MVILIRCPFSLSWAISDVTIEQTAWMWGQKRYGRRLVIVLLSSQSTSDVLYIVISSLFLFLRINHPTNSMHTIHIFTVAVIHNWYDLQNMTAYLLLIIQYHRNLYVWSSAPFAMTSNIHCRGVSLLGPVSCPLPVSDMSLIGPLCYHGYFFVLLNAAFNIWRRAYIQKIAEAERLYRCILIIEKEEGGAHPFHLII